MAIPPTAKTNDNDTSDHGLDPTIETYCITPVMQYRFKPCMFQGKPVAVDLLVEVTIRKF